jgi:hypothetical protein
MAMIRDTPPSCPFNPLAFLGALLIYPWFWLLRQGSERAQPESSDRE